MKKTIKSLLAIAIGAFAFAACSDIPEPSGYSTTPAGQGGSGSGGTEIYTSGNLNTGWTLQGVTPDQPWIKGSKYAQATGYQDWDGSGKKNKAVEAWLVSPVISTAGYESVKISFDQTIKYTNNVQGWEQNHKVYASNNYDGSNISAANWVELPFTPVASPYSDWTTYSSGEIQLPSEMAGKEKVYVAFYFKAPATNSTTWEVLNFKMMSGTASGGEGGGGSSDETLGTLDNPLTIDQALAEFDKLDDNGKTTIDAIVTGVVSRNITSADNFNQYKNINYYISVDGTENGKEVQVYKGMGLNNVAFTAVTDIKQGDQVIVRGKLYKYKNKNTGAIIPEIENGYLLKYTAGSGGGAETADQPKGDGSQGNPFNVAGAVAKCKEIGTTPSAQEFYVKGVAAAEATVTDATNKNITVDLVDNGYTQKFKAYRVIAADGKKLKMGYKIAKGATVIVYGKLVNYNENTPEISWTKDTYNGTLVSVDGQIPEVDDGQGGGESGGESGGGDDSGMGTLDNPYTVAAAQTAGDKNGQYVQAYIVGFVNGASFATGATFSAENASASNIMIAASPDETNSEKCMPVQLPANTEVRTGVNLKDNPGNLKKEILLYGNLAAYFGTTRGVKAVSYAKIGTTEYGTKP